MADIKIVNENNVHICTLEDSYLDFDNVFNLNESLKLILNSTDNSSPKIIFDLLKLKTIDSSGIAFLMLIKNKIEEINGILTIINISDYIKKAFSYVDITKYFNIFDSKNEAMKFLGRS